MSLNNRLSQRCDDLSAKWISRLEEIGVNETRISKARVLDFGTSTPGTLAGGVLLARLCLADLGTVSIRPSTSDDSFMIPEIVVETSHPLQACMASQFAGWPVSAEGWFGMGSGPGRIKRGKEPFFERYPIADNSDTAWVIVESSKPPNDSAIEMMATECNVAPEKLVVCVARTASLAGSIQIVARSVETTMHKLFELGFDLNSVNSAVGSAPLPPIGNNDLQSIGWTNDSILYGSRIWLCVDCEQSGIDAVLPKVPSSSSADYGRPFRDIFERYNRDFYAIDKMLFSPAQLTIHNLRTGKTLSAGKVRGDLLKESFGIGACDTTTD